MNNILLKISVFLTFIFCISCTKIDTIDLPDLNTESFSVESVLKKQEILEEKKMSVDKLNQIGNENECR